MTNLIINELKNKKNYFLLNLVICIVLTIVMPFLLEESERFFGIVATLVSIVVAMVSAFSDNNFMHNDGKLAYYLSKPVSFKRLIDVKLIANVIFGIAIFILTCIIAQVSGSMFSGKDLATYSQYTSQFRAISFAWMVAMMFVLTLSCVLTGNTVVAFLSSIFNFAFPGIVYLILNYVFEIVESMDVGISNYVMDQMLQSYILPIDKLYFFRCEGIYSIMYYIQLILICAIVYGFIQFAIKRRKNENTGYYIVHKGYKYFISLFASLVLPIAITLLFGFGYERMITVLIILSALSYYVLISIFNKSFRLSRSAIKIYVPFIVIMALVITATSLIVKYRGGYIPEASDIKTCIISNSMDIYDNDKRVYVNVYDADINELDNVSDAAVFTDKEDIENVIKLHQELLENNNTQCYSNIYIIYVLNNNLKIVRNFNLRNNDLSNINHNIDDIAGKLANTEEFKKSKYYAFYDEEYIKNFKYANVNIYNTDIGHDISVNNFDYTDFAVNMRKDIDTLILSDRFNTEFLVNNSYDFDHMINACEDTKETDDYESFFEVSFEQMRDNQKYNDFKYIQVPESFVNTYKYLSNLK